MEPIRRRVARWSLRVAFWSLVGALAVGSAAHAQTRPEPLSGVAKVTVLVMYGATGEPPSGISEQRLQTVLELKLRTAGLRVLTMQEDLVDPDINPYMYLWVATIETRNQSGRTIGYTYRLDLSARVLGTVPFNKARAPMELWSDGTMAVADRDSASADIERIVGTLADDFLNAWLKANPKK